MNDSTDNHADHKEITVNPPAWWCQLQSQFATHLMTPLQIKDRSFAAATPNHIQFIEAFTHHSSNITSASIHERLALYHKQYWTISVLENSQ